MSDDGRRPLTEEERDRIHAARRDGGMCAACGRALVEGETIWFERVDVNADGSAYWRVPVGAECLATETLRATCRTEPERCVGCGRGVVHHSGHPLRRVVSCSKRCALNARAPRRKEGPRS